MEKGLLMATLFPTRATRGAVLDGCARLASRIVRIIASFRRSVKISRSQSTTYSPSPVSRDNDQENNVTATIEPAIGIDLAAADDEDLVALLFGEPVRRPTPGCVEGSQRIHFGYIDVPRDFPRRLEEQILAAARGLYAVAQETVEELERQGRDPLTQLLIRRVGADALQRELARAARSGSPLCVAFFDADGLKRINDTLGHSVGDVVLRAIGAAVRKCSRISDVQIRWGGDEFVVAMPNTTVDKAGHIARNIQKALAQTVVTHEGHIVNASLSFGIAVSRIDDTSGSVVKRADDGMYEAKRETRQSSKSLRLVKGEA